MKNLRLLIGLILSSSLCFGQVNNMNFNDFSVENSSGEILNIIKEEIIKQKITFNNRVAQDVLINTNKEREKYLGNFQDQLIKVTQNATEEEVLLKVPPKELEKYGNRALNRFKTVSGGVNVNVLIAPILGSSFKSYARDTIVSYFVSKIKKLDTLANDVLSMFVQKGIDYKRKTEKEIYQEIDYLKKILNPQALDDILFEEVTKRVLYLIKNASSTIEFFPGDIRKKFLGDFSRAQKSIDIIARNAFQDLGKNVTILAKNEEKVNLILDNIQVEIRNRKKVIDKIESDLLQLAKSPAATQMEIAKKQIEHAQLVAQNIFQTNVITGYLKDGISILNKLDNFKATAARLFPGDGSNQFKNQLDIFKTPTLSGVVKFAGSSLDNIESISGGLEKLGVINKAAAKKVASFVKGAQLAIGIATALLPPNPIGIIGALGSLGGLFGGGGPSLEEQMFQEMQKGFEQINARLDVIESKLDRLSDFVEVMYKDMMKSFQLISADLKTLLEKQDLLLQMANYRIYSTYNLVEIMISNRPKNVKGLELYSRWFSNSVSNNQALMALDEFISSPKNLKDVISADFTSPSLPNSYMKIAEQETKAYNKTKLLYKSLYPHPTNRQKNLLLIPAQKNSFDVVLRGEEITPDISVFDFEVATDKYINCIFLSNITNQYLTLHPFFVLSGKNANNYAPIQNLQELLKEYQTVVDKLEPSRKKLKNILEFLNYGILQQSLYAGHTLVPSINNALLGTGEFYEEAIDALKENDLLKKNLSVYLINSKIDKDDLNKAFDLIEQSKLDRSKVSDLNSLLKYSQGKLKFAYSKTNLSDITLYLTYVNSAGADVVMLPLPDVSFIQNEEFLYNDNFYLLLQVKDKLIDAIIDLSFFEGISTEQQAVYKQMFFNN